MTDVFNPAFFCLQLISSHTKKKIKKFSLLAPYPLKGVKAKTQNESGFDYVVFSKVD